MSRRDAAIARGAGLGGLTAVAVSAAWAVVVRGRVDVHGYDIHANEIIAIAVVIGIPYGVAAGALLGWCAVRVRRQRAIASLAVAVGLVPNAIEWLLVELDPPCTFPIADMCIHAVVPTLISAALLERWTRLVPAVPVAAIVTVRRAAISVAPPGSARCRSAW